MQLFNMFVVLQFDSLETLEVSQGHQLGASKPIWVKLGFEPSPVDFVGCPAWSHAISQDDVRLVKGFSDKLLKLMDELPEDWEAMVSVQIGGLLLAVGGEGAKEPGVPLYRIHFP